MLLWFLVAWPLPAVVAGALGWEGIWGSGGALTDYLVPIPVAGGALHVPSFALCTLAVYLAPSLGAVGAGRVRAALVGVALVGLLWLLKLPELLLARQTGSTFIGSVWQQNPLGLFFVSDGLLALLFTSVRGPRPLFRFELPALALALLPAALPLAMAWPASLDEQPFKRGAGQVGATRGDETLFVYTATSPNATGFRERALAWASAPETFMHPRYHIDNEDVAVMFTQDLDAANQGDRARVGATLCLYEDGTEPQWHSGAGDCFGEHQSFSERLHRAMDARSADEPGEAGRRAAARELCSTVQPPAASPGMPLELASTRLCAALAN